MLDTCPSPQPTSSHGFDKTLVCDAVRMKMDCSGPPLHRMQWRKKTQCCLTSSRHDDTWNRANQFNLGFIRPEFDQRSCFSQPESHLGAFMCLSLRRGFRQVLPNLHTGSLEVSQTDQVWSRLLGRPFYSDCSVWQTLRVLVVQSFFHLRIVEVIGDLGTFNAAEFLCSFPSICASTIIVPELCRQALQPHGWVFALTSCETLYRQLWAFLIDQGQKTLIGTSLLIYFAQYT